VGTKLSACAVAVAFSVGIGCGSGDGSTNPQTAEVQVQALTTGPNDDAWPEWSPDGTKFAVLSNGSAVVFPIAGGTPLVLSPVGETMRWSPDGLFLAATIGQMIMLLPAGGGTPIVLSAVPGVPDSPPE
jgi:hypothetical protein